METPPLNRTSLLIVSMLLEGALLLVAALWMAVSQIPLLEKMQPSLSAVGFGIATGIATITFSMVCLTLGKNWPFLKDLRKMSEEFLAPLMSKLNPFDILLLSVLSGFCEEVFFRGILQAELGLVGASLIFGVFHDPSLKQKAYVVLASLAGLALGYLYQYTDNLWSAIAAHTFHNAVSMMILRYWIKPTPENDEKAV